MTLTGGRCITCFLRDNITSMGNGISSGSCREPNNRRATIAQAILKFIEEKTEEILKLCYAMKFYSCRSLKTPITLNDETNINIITIASI